MYKYITTSIFCLKDRITERGRERERIFSLLVYSQVAVMAKVGPKSEIFHSSLQHG